ncbi:MAG: methylmalonyl-CoA mutase family protein [Thermodesulfobacteriota bacterium]|nr:methylmalonyl-CoA mutase family protein [Thermodesulfobacteriota bacterium]
MGERQKNFNDKSLREIQKESLLWKKSLKENDESTEPVESLSGIPIEPVYTPEHVAGTNYLEDLGFPGQMPFVRGVYPTMYRGRLWTMRQLAGFGPPEETNTRYLYLLKQGATGLNSTFDYPTLRGYDSDDPLAIADAGRGGVAIDTIEDMGLLFQGIPIDNVSVSLVTCQPICNISVQSMYFAYAQSQGISMEHLTGTSQNDFMMETAITIAPGVLRPEASFRLCCDAIEYCTRHAFRWNPVSFAGYNYREAGCTTIQEIAFALQNACACVEELIRRGVSVDDFASRLSFFFSAQSDFFEEIAKYRAARRIWGRIMKDRFHAEKPRSCALRFHVQTAGASLTAQQPLNNITRAAYQALSAVLGGAQSVHVDAYDEALCMPTQLSSLTALRTQQILQHETRTTHTADPLGGSYFIESLTNEIEERVLSLMDEIDTLGGMVKAVSSGWIHSEIAASAYEYQRSIESGKIKVVGVNCYRNEEDIPIEIFEVPETVEVQRRKLERIKKERNNQKVRAVLDSIARACESNENLMEIMVDSVKERVTVGEVSAILKAQFGTWDPPLF